MNTLNTLFESHFEHYVRSLPAHSLYEPVRYILSLGGKRVRPLSALMACRLWKEPDKDALNAALAIEVFHNFTLMHDDIMDRAPLRRGQPTVHEKWNTPAAILSGDVMLVEAYRLLAMLPAERCTAIMNIFNKVAADVCLGQQWDMDFEARKQIEVTEYLEMIRLKTAVLLGGAMQMGAMAGGAPDMDGQHLFRFGENLGVAFQLHDDILDSLGDPAKTGKQTGGDILADKKTYLQLIAWQKAGISERQDLERAIQYQGDEKVKAIRQVYLQLDVRTDAEEKMNEYLQNALHALDQVKCSAESRTELRQFAQQLMQRTH